jgi:hypothetical protein
VRTNQHQQPLVVLLAVAVAWTRHTFATIEHKHTELGRIEWLEFSSNLLTNIQDRCRLTIRRIDALEARSSSIQEDTNHNLQQRERENESESVSE